GGVGDLGEPAPAPMMLANDSTPAPGARFTVTVTCTVPEVVQFTFMGEMQTVTCQSGASGLTERFVETSTRRRVGIASAVFVAPTIGGTFPVVAELQTTGRIVALDITVEATTPAPV